MWLGGPASQHLYILHLPPATPETLHLFSHRSTPTHFLPKYHTTIRYQFLIIIKILEYSDPLHCLQLVHWYPLPCRRYQYRRRNQQRPCQLKMYHLPGNIERLSTIWMENIVMLPSRMRCGLLHALPLQHRRRACSMSSQLDTPARRNLVHLQSCQAPRSHSQRQSSSFNYLRTPCKAHQMITLRLPRPRH